MDLRHAAAFFLLPDASKSISSIYLLCFDIYAIYRCTLLFCIRARRSQKHHGRYIFNKKFRREEDTKRYEIVFSTIRFPSKYPTSGKDYLCAGMQKNPFQRVSCMFCLSFCLSTYLTIVVSSVDRDDRLFRLLQLMFWPMIISHYHGPRYIYTWVLICGDLRSLPWEVLASSGTGDPYRLWHDFLPQQCFESPLLL